MHARILISALFLAGCSQQADQDQPPDTARQDDVRSFHGEAVAEPYAWLEDMDAPAVREWAQQQDRHARARYDEAAAKEISARIQAVAGVARYMPPILRSGRHFYVSFDASASQASAWLRRGDAGVDELLIDGAKLFEDGRALHRQLWPSPDGRLLAYGITDAGSRWMEVRVRNIETGTDLEDKLQGLVALSSTLSWLPDASGFFYEQFELPAPENRLQARLRAERVRLHRLGKPQAADELVFEAADPDNDVLSQNLSEDGRFLVVGVRDGRADSNRIWVRDWAADQPEFREVTVGAVAHFSFVGSRGNQIWLQTDLDAPRGKVIAIDWERPGVETWRDLVPQRSDATIDTWVGATGIGRGLVIGYRTDSRLSFDYLDNDGALLRRFEPPNLGSVWTGFFGRQGDENVFFTVSNFADPGTVYSLALPDGEAEIWLRPDLPYDPDDIVVEQWFFDAPARDRQPMFIAFHRDTPPDGWRPIMMYGYGTGGWIAAPWFRAHMPYWLQGGGTIALPALRGGGEYGESWRLAGARQNKPNSVADYIAAAEWLIEAGHASPDTLVAETNSAGGPAVGAAVLQRPELFGAAIFGFPLLDMLAYESFTHAGRWRTSFGSVENPDEFEALRAYSPVHNVEPDRCYPPVLIAPGALDEITPPLHAYKFTAALQHAQSCDRPILMRIAWNAGHAYGGSPQESAEAFAYQMLFLREVLGGE